MIKFFRKIRLNLMETGKTAKYFKYAIGEIILVVIGILLALQINNWNENRKASLLEIEYVKRLISENKEDLALFSEKIQGLKRGATSIKKFSEALKSVSFSDSLLILKANDYLKYGSIYPVFTSSTSTFDDLSSTGNLQIISNIKVRDQIVNHYTKHKVVADWIQVATNWALPLDAPFTYEHHVMKFEPLTSFLYPKQSSQELANELRIDKLSYITNAAAHYWINMDAIQQLEILKDDTIILISILEKNLNQLTND